MFCDIQTVIITNFVVVKCAILSYLFLIASFFPCLAKVALRACGISGVISLILLSIGKSNTFDFSQATSILNIPPLCDFRQPSVLSAFLLTKQTTMLLCQISRNVRKRTF